MKLKSFCTGAALMLTTLMLVIAAATAQTYTDLYDFGANSSDPNDPRWTGVIAEGPDGNLYSTTGQGWLGGNGDVFSITPAGILTVLYNFNGTDGQSPFGGLTLASDGNFYGTTNAGGAAGYGTIFKITAGGSLTTLYNFSGMADGGSPTAPPIQGTDGNFYGTTIAGGTNNDGSIYMITSSGTLTTLHSFDGSDGINPAAPLMQASDGNFYGTTVAGGTNSDGTVFRISSSGTFDVLFNFVGSGTGSYAPLIQGSDGNFYGTEAGNLEASSGGTVFQITPSGEFTVLYTFTGGSDGQNPCAGLVQATDGNFYGTNDLGGGYGWGVLFRISSTGTFATLYAFGAGSTGASPQATLVQHTNGLFYGDTAVGGAFGYGQFYSFNVGLVGGAMAGLSPNPLTFAAQPVGTTSTAQIVTLTNIGGKSFNLTHIAASGDFAETNTCSTSLAAGSSCQISVTFTPTAPGNRAGAVTITDSAPGSPQTVGLVGIAVAPAVSFSPPSLTFPSEYVGTPELNQNVQLTNSGTATLTITSVVASPASDFSQLSACGSSLAAGASCSIGVFFDPSASGTRSGTLTVTDNAPNSPQVVALTGIGQDFSMSSSPPSQSISPGQTATYSVTVAPAGGFNQTVALSCSGAPAQSICSLSSNSVTLKGSTSTVVNVTVTTAAGSVGLLQPFDGRRPYGRTFAWLLFCSPVALALSLTVSNSLRGRRRHVLYALAILAVLSIGTALPACGGGSVSSGGGGTQAGTYNLTVTGEFTSGPTTLTHTAKLTLVVR